MKVDNQYPIISVRDIMFSSYSSPSAQNVCILMYSLSVLELENAIHFRPISRSMILHSAAPLDHTVHIPSDGPFSLSSLSSLECAAGLEI